MALLFPLALPCLEGACLGLHAPLALPCPVVVLPCLVVVLPCLVAVLPCLVVAPPFLVAFLVGLQDPRAPLFQRVAFPFRTLLGVGLLYPSWGGHLGLDHLVRPVLLAHLGLDLRDMPQVHLLLAFQHRGQLAASSCLERVLQHPLPALQDPAVRQLALVEPFLYQRLLRVPDQVLLLLPWLLNPLVGGGLLQKVTQQSHHEAKPIPKFSFPPFLLF